MNSNNNRRIECFMFKIVCKTPLLTKKVALQVKLAILLTFLM